MELSKTLEQYGFTQNESRIYLYILKNGESTVYTIAQGTKIPRATTYLTLEKLKNQGFISTYKKNNVAQFSAESPNNLLKFLKDKESLIQESLPALFALTKERETHPTIKYYSGKESIKTVFTGLYENLYKKKLNRLFVVSHPELNDFFPKYLPQVLNWKKEKLDIHASVIVPGIMEDKIPKIYEPDEFRETRFLPKEFPFKGTLMIAGDRIAIFTIKEDMIFAVTIDSKTISELITQLFLFTWSMIEPKKN